MQTKGKICRVTGDWYVQAVLAYIYCLQLAPFLYSHIQVWALFPHTVLKEIKFKESCFLASRNTTWFTSKFLFCCRLPFQIVCLFLQILLTEKKSYTFFVLLHVSWLEQFQQPFSSVSFNFNQFWHPDCPFLEKVDYFILFDLEVIPCYVLYIHIPDCLTLAWCCLLFEHLFEFLVSN